MKKTYVGSEKPGASMRVIARGILDVLGGHPLLGASLKRTPGGVVLQRADSTPGDGCV